MEKYMQLRSLVIKLYVVLFLCCGLCVNVKADTHGSITLDHIESSAGNIVSNSRVTFYFRVQSPDSFNIDATRFNFIFTSPDSASWTYLNGEETPDYYCFSPYWSDFFKYWWETSPSQRLLWQATIHPTPGQCELEYLWTPGSDGVAFTVSMDITPESVGKIISIDSITDPFSANGGWTWHTPDTDQWLNAAWGGPYTFTVADCCQGIRGNINGDPLGNVNVVDAVAMVNYIFANGTPPACMKEADADGTGTVNIMDYLVLRNWMFYGGPPPVACP